MLLSIACLSGERLRSVQKAVKVQQNLDEGLFDISKPLRTSSGFFVPPSALENEDNGEEWPCPVHGKANVGDPGLAHQLLGRLRLARSECSNLFPNAGGGNADNDGAGRSGPRLVDVLVRSIKRCAVAPLLVPVN
jgi:hypothetical protein